MLTDGLDVEQALEGLLVTGERRDLVQCGDRVGSWGIRQEGQLAEEGAGPDLGDLPLAAIVLASDLDVPGGQDQELVALVALLEQAFAGGVGDHVEIVGHL